MHLKSTHLWGLGGETHCITIVPFNSYFELNKSTTSLTLSLIETCKSEMNILAAVLKEIRILYLFTLIHSSTSPISFQLCTNTSVADMGQ